MKWWERYGVECVYRETCWHCSAPIKGTEHFIMYGFSQRRNMPERVRAIQVCGICEGHESAMLEAQDECRKYIEIEVSIRCTCGQAALAATGECMQCGREKRMLDKRWAAIKLARRLLLDVKREIRNRTRAGDDG